jgi:hypothetical protein
MTATAEQLDVLKQSLSNFKDAAEKAVDDEYIEEIFEDEAEHNSRDESIVEMTEADRLEEER